MAKAGTASLSLALEQLSKHSLMDFGEAVDTLLVFVSNLIEFPEEEKYHRILATNIHFQERLGRLPASEAALNSIGYVRKGDYYVLDVPDLSKEERQAELANLKAVLGKRRDEVAKRFMLLPERLDDSHEYSAVIGASFHNEIGKRNNNEDDDIIVDRFTGKPDWIYLGLYDGHGGRQTVEYVVKALHMCVENILLTEPDLPISSALIRAYEETDGHVRRRDILQSGTTAVSVIIRPQSDGKTQQRILHCANVGDSRAVLCRAGQAIRLTVDHKPSLEEEKARINKAGGFVGQGNRVNGVLAISRALGDHTLKSHDVVTATPYTRDIVLTDDDNYLILACDGLWDEVTDQQACEFVLGAMEHAPKNLTVNQQLKGVCTDLVHHALDLGSTDNVTVMICKLR